MPLSPAYSGGFFSASFIYHWLERSSLEMGVIQHYCISSSKYIVCNSCTSISLFSSRCFLYISLMRKVKPGNGDKPNRHYCISSSKYIVCFLQGGGDEKLSGSSADVDPPKQVNWLTVTVYVCEDSYSSVWAPRTFSQLPLYEPTV